MMDNYKFSLFRKRNYFKVRRYKVKKWFEEQVTKARLEELVWEISIVKIVKKYSIHHSYMTELCKKWGIALPPLGYWKRKMLVG